MLGLKARCLHFSLGGSLEGYGNPCGPRTPYYPELSGAAGHKPQEAIRAFI